MRVLRGKFSPIPSHYSSTLRHVITTLLHTDANRRPSLSDLLGMECMQASFKELMKGEAVWRLYTTLTLPRSLARCVRTEPSKARMKGPSLPGLQHSHASQTEYLCPSTRHKAGGGKTGGFGMLHNNYKVAQAGHASRREVPTVGSSLYDRHRSNEIDRDSQSASSSLGHSVSEDGTSTSSTVDILEKPENLSGIKVSNLLKSNLQI